MSRSMLTSNSRILTRLKRVGIYRPKEAAQIATESLENLDRLALCFASRKITI